MKCACEKREIKIEGILGERVSVVFAKCQHEFPGNIWLKDEEQESVCPICRGTLERCLECRVYFKKGNLCEEFLCPSRKQHEVKQNKGGSQAQEERGNTNIH